MATEDINKQDFLELIEKYLDGKITIEELKLLVNYYESYQQEHTWDEVLGSEETIRNRMLINILEELQNTEEAKVVPLYKKSWFKYAVAASIVLMVSFAFLLKEDKTVATETKMVHVEPSNIEIGTDKATLTLGDGSQVALEKGESFNRKNIKSNGKELVYDSGKAKAETVEYNYLTIPRGGQFFLKLSDGTQVWLNSESKLKYPVSFIAGQPRTVELIYGEAYFDVSPSHEHNGSKFLVLNASQEVEVLGTEFNIKAYSEEAAVFTTLVEGKVAVNLEGRQQSLVPGQQLYLNKTNSTLMVKTVDVYNETAWKDGVFSFEDKPLKDMMTVLSRWYDVEVVFENKSIESQEFVGILRKNQNIEEILSSIKNFGIIKNYEIYDKKVILQ